MTKTELKAVPLTEIHWREPLKNLDGLYILPLRRKHDSGYNCIELVAEFRDGRPMVRIDNGTDDICFEGSHFRMDCDNGIFHIWNNRPFQMHGVSSMTLEEYDHG
jgi:hypothetical protein